MSDISSILIWWLTLFLIGLSLYPFTRRLFFSFIDHGYSFSKVIGIFLLSFIIWILSTLHILPFFRESILLVLLGLMLLNGWFFLYKKPIYKKENHKDVSLAFFIIEEILFLGALAFWSFVRGMEPSIHGLEKFMDFGFVSSILRSSYFPPLDMWLTRSPDYTGGYFINYYFFGHLITAVLTKLSGLNSAITYNLMIATLFAFTFSLTFSIGLNLVYFLQSTLVSKLKSLNFKLLIIGGLLTAFIVSFGGNLHTIYTFTQGYPNDKPQPFWQLPLGWNPQSYWYPNATRFIPFTIHEFPIYSFVVADLHGHVSDIPFVLLTLALLINLLIKPNITNDKNPRHDSQSKIKWLSDFLIDFQTRTSISLPYLIFLSSLLAVMYMTNAVDGPIYMLLTALVLLYRNWKSSGNLKTTFIQTASASLFLAFFFLLAGLPFSINFKPFGTGIGVLCAPQILLGKHFGPVLFEIGKCQKSPLFMLSLLWGFFYFNIFAFFILVALPRLRSIIYTRGIQKKEKTISSGQKAKNLSFTHNPIAMYLERILGNISVRTSEIRLNSIDIFVILTSFISTLLLIFPEYFYIKDIYPMHYRANTMFKLGYQAFMMLGINSAYIFMRIKLSQNTLIKYIYIILFLPLFFLIAIYPFFAINSYYGGLKNYQGLDGLTWLKRDYASDYDAIIWLRQNISGQPVILEANGESYTDYARVSSYTGLPTVIGWPVHEWLWRGSYDESGKRIPQVQTLYESQDLNETKQLLDKYNISLIFIGTLEYQKYPNLYESKWNNLGKVIFQSGNTKIYKINTP